MEETKQGVAQKFIDERKRVHEYLSSHGDYAAINVGYGLEECQSLVRLLSAEAQRILDEEGFERRPQIVAVLREAFTRLGLDLEGEDE